MSVTQGSTLYGGSVSQAAIYEISQGLGLVWGQHVRTEMNVDGKPRQLTRASNSGNPITENVRNPRDVDFAATSDTVIDGRNLSVSELMVPQAFPVADFKDTFPKYQPTGLSIDLKSNPKIQKVVFDRLMEAAKTQLNELHSVGDTALAAPNPLRFYNGYITQMLTDVDATEVGVATNITLANVIDRVYELRNSVHPRLINSGSLKIFMSYADYFLYDQARGATQTQVPNTDVKARPGIENISGIPMQIVPVLGIPKNFMFATIADTTSKSNLVQGVWMEQDQEAVKMYKTTEGDQDYKLLMRMDIGVQYVTGLDIYYVQGI